jgi:clan AA aspartic protease (TIGR02281 family)
VIFNLKPNDQKRTTKMKTLLLSTVAALALGGVANATDLACSTPQFLVGQESKDPQDTVNRIEVRHSSNSPEWQVHHRFQNGTMVMRQEQYAMVDASSPNGWVWQGRLRKNGAITMVGELRRDSQGQAYYMETQYDRGRVTMKTRSACSVMTAAISPPIAGPGPYQPLDGQVQPVPPQPAQPTAAEDKRRQAELAAEEKRKEAELAAEQQRKQAEWETEQQRKQAEWEIDRKKKQAEWEAEQERRKTLLNPQIKKEIISLKIKNNTMRLNVGLGDQVVTMLLDTGATASLITSSLASSLIRDDQARYVGPTKMTTASGEVVSAKEIVIYELKLGNQVVRNVKAMVMPGDIELLLGVDVLNSIGPYLIDSPNSQLIFTVKTAAADVADKKEIEAKPDKKDNAKPEETDFWPEGTKISDECAKQITKHQNPKTGLVPDDLTAKVDSECKANLERWGNQLTKNMNDPAFKKRLMDTFDRAGR